MLASVYKCVSLCVYAAGFLGQVAQQWLGQNSTKSLLKWHTSPRVSHHVLLLGKRRERERRREGGREKNSWAMVTGSHREKDREREWGENCLKPSYETETFDWDVCIYVMLCLFLSVLWGYVCVCGLVWVTDQRRWTTDRARHPGTIKIHIRTLVLPSSSQLFSLPLLSVSHHPLLMQRTHT